MKIARTNYEAFFLDYYEGTLPEPQVAELMLFLEQHPDLKEQFYDFENISLNDFEDDIAFGNKEELKKAQITEDNFEEMAIAYTEGLLNKEQEKELLAFAEKDARYKKQLELFAKTKLPLEQISFGDRSKLLKKEEEQTAFSAGEFSAAELLFIASVEGTLTPAQQNQLDVLVKAPEFKKELELFKETKLTVESNIVFADKESLKRRDRKGVPFYYYVAAAASLALLFGFYALFSKTQHGAADPSIAKMNASHKLQGLPQQDPSTNNSNVIVQVKSNGVHPNNIITPNVHPQDGNNDQDPQQIDPDHNVIVQNPVPVKGPDTIVKKDVIVQNTASHKNDILLVNSFSDPDDQPQSNDDYLSLGQVFASKVKDKLLSEEMQDENSYKEDKKKFTWYDAVLVATKGIRKLTGRDINLKKEYNSNNELIAYQFNAGRYVYTRPVSKKI